MTSALTMQSSTMSEHEGDSGVESTHSSSGESFLYIRVAVPELNLQKCLQFNPEDTVWVAKQQILATFAKDLKDGLNYGVFCPPVNGRAGKFLDEERLLKDYSLPGPIGYLEFKYKRRVYKQLTLNPRKLKQINCKANFKQFVEAVRRSDVHKIVKLTDKGLDPNFQDQESGEVPLTLATSLLRPHSVIMALVDGGAMFDFRSRNGMTPMHKAAKLGNAEAISTLLDLGAGVNYRDERGLTPLYHAVCHSTSATCVNLLLYNYAIVGVTDSTGWTELHQACKVGRVQHVEQLLFYGAEMSLQNSGGNTPLHVCAINNQEECARILLFRGADKMVKNYANQTAAEVAIIANNEQLSCLISDFSPSDIVPIQEIPSYNTKRRAHLLTSGPSFQNLQRCRSNPQLYSRNSIAGLSAIHGGGGTLSRSKGQLVERCTFQVDQVFHDKRSPQMFTRHRRSNGDPLHGYDTDSLRSTSVSSVGSVSGSTGGDNESFGHLRQLQATDVILNYEVFDIQILFYFNTHVLSDQTVATVYKMFSHVIKKPGKFMITTLPVYQSGKNLAQNIELSTHNRRSVYLQKGGHGFGFVLRGAKCDSSSKIRNGFMLDFNPSAQCPGLQYIELVDPDSAADLAGLLAGDFITEINGVSVVCASHEYAVQLIRNTVDQLVLTVVTVKVSQPTTARHSPLHGQSAPDHPPLPRGPSSSLNVEEEDSSQLCTRRQSVASEPRVSWGKPMDAVSIGGNLTRFGSVPSLLVDCTSKSSLGSRPQFSGRPSFIIDEEPMNVPEVVYAVPTKEDVDLEDEHRPPPLPPPPEFRLHGSVGGELVSIATKVTHTYANVSQWINESSSDIESSFRPGMSAQLSQDDTRLLSIVPRRSTAEFEDGQQTASIAVVMQPQPVKHDHTSSNGAEVYHNRTALSPALSNGSSIEQQYELENMRYDDTRWSRIHGDEHGLSKVIEDSELPPPPPPPPPISAEHLALFNVLQAAPLVPQPPLGDGVILKTAALPPAGPQFSQRKADVPEEKSSRVHADEIRQAVLMRREFVDTSDMRNVAATIEQRILRARPLQRMVYKADRTKQAFKASDSQPVPLNQPASKPILRASQPVDPQVPSSQPACQMIPQSHLIRYPVPPSQPAAVLRRTTMCSKLKAVEIPTQAPSGGLVLGLTSCGNSSSDFLAMAEHARQEYVKRRVSSVGEASSVVMPVSSKSESLSSFAQMIADKAMQRRRNTIVGNSADVLFCSDLHEPPQLGRGASLNNEDRTSKPQCSLEQDTAHPNEIRDSPIYYDRDVNSSLSAAVDSSRTCYSSTSCSEFNLDAQTIYLSDASSTPDYVSLIVPPPPDFLAKSVDSTVSESSFSRDFEIITPPPPPGFNDEETCSCSSADVLHRPVFSWTIDDVASWLDSLQLSEHRDHFKECLIDGPRLTNLGRSELIQLGVTQVGQRMNLERAIKRALMAKH